MILSREKYDEILAKYVMDDSDAEKAFDFVHDVLAAEADETERKVPYATRTIADLNEAAYTVFTSGSDAFWDNFNEED